MNGKHVIDSHNSRNTNEVVTELIAAINGMGIKAANSPHITSVTSYYNAINELYTMVLTILPGDHKMECEKVRKGYYTIYQRIVLGERTASNLQGLLGFAQSFKFYVLQGLQYHKYLFRVKKVEEKGMRHMKIFADGAFGNPTADGTVEEHDEMESRN